MAFVRPARIILQRLCRVDLVLSALSAIRVAPRRLTKKYSPFPPAGRRISPAAARHQNSPALRMPPVRKDGICMLCRVRPESGRRQLRKARRSSPAWPPVRILRLTCVSQATPSNLHALGAKPAGIFPRKIQFRGGIFIDDHTNQMYSISHRTHQG